MRVLEATGNTIEAIRKAWELRQDLTDKENRRNCRNTVSSRSNSSSYSGYTGEFRLSLAGSENGEDGALKNLTLRVSNGLTDNAAHAGRVLLGGKLLAKCPAYSRTVSSSETSLSAVFVWLKLELADSTIRFMCSSASFRAAPHARPITDLPSLPTDTMTTPKPGKTPDVQRFKP